ncbi:glucosaminidase domain-containing protein [Paenibacillus sp. FSL R7-0337]|uniref:glucosaminidase domain-containing protein n=1 Tax=Paenibacillus sp. FSL R7-0337 TaxID=1926588 RepID=UPI00096CEBDF|nr:glucosaminidase domain-containing protein [Paenibacillus sp. FSL R7-0337]OMF98172.1 hypothetical protein BK147_11160 [Paenibacillus sp. FSL R7-0337]
MNSNLGGTLKGKGDVFAAAGAKYGIDPALLAAIAVHETGNGTSPASRNRNNVGGMMRRDGKGLQSFDSIDAGIDAMASNLKRLYFDQGLNTIEKIQKKYAPNGAANDPTNLNQHWVSGVSKYYRMFGGG